MKPFALRGSLVCGLLALAACSGGDSGGPNAVVKVQALSLPGVANVCFDLQVSNQDGDSVVAIGTPGQSTPNKFPADTRAACSERYGNGGGGDIAYVAPCDASLVDDDGDRDLDDPNTNTVTVWVDGLYDASDVDIGQWQDPCPDGCSVQVDCRENADVEVVIDLMIMRDAEQGFVDIAVNFDDIFCSAKLDCLDELLHNGAERDTTVVVGFACTAGEDDNTTLYLDDIVVTCVGDATHPGRTYTIPPNSKTAGNHGPLPPGIFEHASYFDQEDFTTVDKCFWNNAIGLDLDALEPGCTLTLRGTAGAKPFTTPPFFHTPAHTIYPVVTWTVPLTDGSGALVCGKHPLNGGNGVVTSYTDFVGEQFLNAYDCGETPTTSRITCGNVDGMGPVLVGQTAGNVSLSANGHTVQYPALPSNIVIESCCPDACCVAADGGAR